MMLKSFILPAVLGSVLLFFGYVQCKDPKLTPYGKKVKSLIDDDTLNTIFNTNADSKKQMREAMTKASKNFDKIVGLEHEEGEEDKYEEETEDVKKLEPEVYFHVQTYAIAKCFRELHKLDDDNIDDKAQQLADQLKDAAKDVKDPDDYVETFVAQTTATANFYKDNGVTSRKDVNKCMKYFSDELEKYQKSED